MDIQELQGLSEVEVAKRRKQYGYNELPSREKKNFIKIFVGLVSEPMILLLIITVIIYFFLGDSSEAFLLLSSVFVIMGVEIYQEGKTEKSLEALRNLSSPICVVVRDGKRRTIPGRETVMGDTIYLSEGSRVPADAKLILAQNLLVDESLLTGESVSVNKKVDEDESDKTGLVYSGTLVVKGHGIAIVTGIGSGSEIGKIGNSLSSIGTEKTLLQKEVTKVVKVIATIAVSMSLILMILFWILRGSLVHGILAGLTLAIAILPEEFPIVLTIFLTLGAWRLARKKVLTRRAHTIETLGSATVLCVDKTGTLTENRMKIQEVVLADGTFINRDFTDTSELVKYGVLASQRNPFDPMEEAFIDLGHQVFKSIDDIYGDRKVVREYPIEDDSLAVIYVWDGPDIIAAKGAPEEIFRLCKLNKSEIEQRLNDVKKLAQDGLRVIAVAKGKDNRHVPDNRSEIKFEYLGIVGLADPIRQRVPAAVKTCHSAGIRVVMITGDYPETAANIARQVGLDDSRVVSGAEFEALSADDRSKIVKDTAVFCRVSPSNKLMIVEALKKSGEVVAMTGDGVNDAPALKAAHIGIAMGKRGTDVAREAATIVLLDDNFTSIVRGIRLGRRIYDNLQKSMSYVLAIHIPIAILSLVPVFFNWPIILIPAHIVFLEFIIDPSCTIIFENEREDKNIMNRPSRKLRAPIFSKRLVWRSIIQGMLIAIFVTMSYRFLLDAGWSEEKSRGMTFLILITANIFLTLVISGEKSIKELIKDRNIPMFVILLITSLALILLFTVPFLRELFKFGPLSILEYATGTLIGAIAIFMIIPIKKIINNML
ncbi:cation-translocating P-type ATPase [Candidatus Saccharibacteria bacterium]|nr:cation-translocating P-type ATPase [Candidatus Saccharibacteria bacterium]